MLRTLFGQPEQVADVPLRDAVTAMDDFIGLCLDLKESLPNPNQSEKFRVYAVKAAGLKRTLRELEESLFAARHFSGRIRSSRWEDLTDEELLAYDRHVYFDKNAFIRIFSLLDKLGSLMNDIFRLHTERIKERFSYFTVLRRLQATVRHPELTRQLSAIKERYDDPMGRLRKRRNMEIHFLNAELNDDLAAGYPMLSEEGETWKLEDLEAHMEDAWQGRAMVLETLCRTFRYACGHLRQRHS